MDTGAQKLQVVCGAPNVKKGMKGVFAPVGTYIAGADFTLKESKIRGELSQGMLCSESELCLSDEHDGIIELDASAPLGENYASWAGLDDAVIEIAITPNRGDCLAVRGIARDLAAAGLGTLKPLKIQDNFKSFGQSPIRWNIDLPKDRAQDCLYVTGRYFKNIDNKVKTPDWMKKRLEAVGIKSISALVDITNYITHDLCRPLHVFDTDRLAGNALTIRKAKQGEEFIGLNETHYALNDKMTVIADDKKITSLAGIMGALSSGCDENSRNIFLESAIFDAINIAYTGRELNINSDARYRFERSVDPESVLSGLNYATELILQICGGEASDIVSAGAKPVFNREITLDVKRLKTFGGADCGGEEAVQILENLGFACSVAGDKIVAKVPSFRSDVAHEQCLIEEILRIHGFENIKPISVATLATVTQEILTLPQKRVNYIKRALCARGLSEAYSWSFCDSRKAIGFFQDKNAIPSLTLQNPISSELDVMRPSILPNLLEAMHKNHGRKIIDMHVFEVGPVFENPTPEGQKLVCAGIRSGFLYRKSWNNQEAKISFYDVKADIYAVLDSIGFDGRQLKITRDVPEYYHKGRAACLMLGKFPIAYFGELHPTISNDFAFKEKIMMFEIFLDNIPQSMRKTKTKKQLETSIYQAVSRDFNFVLDENIAAQNLLGIIQKNQKKYLIESWVIDVHYPKDLPAGKKSVTVTLRLQPDEKSFTDEQLNSISKNVIEAANSVGAELRQ